MNTEQFTNTSIEKAKDNRKPISNRDLWIGKVILLLLLAGITGVWYAFDNRETKAEFATMTVADYEPLFEQQKAKQADRPTSLPKAIGIMVLVWGLFYGLYELLGWVLGRGVCELREYLAGEEEAGKCIT